MTLQVVVGGQAGSEGKGAIAAFLAAEHTAGLSVRVAGPNAGHTVIGHCPPDCAGDRALDHLPSAHPWRLRQVPVAAVSNPSEQLAIAAGSEIDLQVLLDEVTSLNDAGYRVSDRLAVDASATLITKRHLFAEQDSGLVSGIGSTGKGVGAARADRAFRSAELLGDHPGQADFPFWIHDSVASSIAQHLRLGGEVLIEGTQGYLLGQHAGHYPKCTSSDCTAIDFLSMAGVSPWLVPESSLQVWVVFRTFPIRVAGDSGPLLGETTWEDLGLPTELTTVTRKPRRVGLWDDHAARAAMYANGLTTYRPGPVRAALTMADQVLPALAGATRYDKLDEEESANLSRLMAQRSSDLGRLIELVGTGPNSVIDLRTKERT